MAEILIGNIKGPQGAKGDKGDKGDTGPQGPAGPQGATGPMPALVNGFTTTEAGIAALDAAAGKTLKDEVTQLNSDMSKIIIGTYIGKPEDGIIEIQAPGIQPNTAIAVNGDFSAANEAYVLGVRTPNEGDIMQVMISGVAGTMRINYIYRKS